MLDIFSFVNLGLKGKKKESYKQEATLCGISFTLKHHTHMQHCINPCEYDLKKKKQQFFIFLVRARAIWLYFYIILNNTTQKTVLGLLQKRMKLFKTLFDNEIVNC